MLNSIETAIAIAFLALLVLLLLRRFSNYCYSYCYGSFPTVAIAKEIPKTIAQNFC